jgi:TRAP-type C4-dicarboxylate transport system substrate-binding protein
LQGLKVRTIGPSNADLMKSFGAQAVSMALGEVYTALERGTVDCAVTGAGPGNGLKLPEVTTHLYTLPLAWSTAGYFVNLAWWNKLEPGNRAQLEKTFAELQDAQWALAAQASSDGLACNVGRAAECKIHVLARKPMVEVKPQADVSNDIRRALADSVLPGWVKRCGDRCGSVYNDVIAPITGVRYSAVR